MTLEIRSARRTFSDLVAVNNISLSLQDGLVYGLVGPNGSGKSTLLLLLARLLKPDSGEIILDGVSYETADKSIRSKIGWMPDDFGMWDTLSPFEILEFFGEFYQLPSKPTKTRIEELLSEFGLAQFKDRPARVISKGQKQKLSFIRSVLHQPKLILLDEPANGLDPIARVHLRHFLRRYAKNGNLVILSSHILSELEDTVDQAIFLSHGKNIEHTKPKVSTFLWEVKCINEPLFFSWAEDNGTSVKQIQNQLFVEANDDEHAAFLLSSMTDSGMGVFYFSKHVDSLEQTYLSIANNQVGESD